MTDQPKGKRTPEIPDNQLDQASGGVGTNQLWGDWFIVQDGRVTSSDDKKIAPNSSDPTPDRRED